MFSMFRKNTKIIVTIIISFIVPGFVLWGVGSAVRTRVLSRAGKIWGQGVTVKEFNASFSSVESQMMLLYGKMYSRLAKFFDFYSLAWDRLTLLGEAKKTGVFVTKSEIIQTIRDIPYFQHENKFSPERYETILQRFFRITSAQFEKREENNLMIKKRRKQIYNTIFVSYAELFEEYCLENEKIQVNFVKFDSKDMRPDEKSIQEKDLKIYFFQNAKKFHVSLQRKISYVEIFLKNQEVKPFSVEEAKAYYKDHKDRFKITENKKIQKTQKSDKKEKEDKKEKAPEKFKSFETVQKNILSELKEQAQRKLAKEKAIAVSEDLLDKIALKDIEKKHRVSFVETLFFDRSGHVEYPSKGKVPYRLVDSSFKLKVGDSGDIIPSYNSFFVFKILGEKAPHTPPFEKIREKVLLQFQEDKSDELCLARAQKIRGEIDSLMKKDKKSFSEVCQKLGLRVEESKIFSRKDRVNEFGDTKFNLKAFALKKGELSFPFKRRGGFSIFTIKEKHPVLKKNEKKAFLKKEYSKKILDAKRSKIYEDWFRMVKMKANVKKNSRYFKT